ncbi:MAG: FxSxx-COOH system tetratricopeptide repeat protein, partial [Pseudonocardiaceae bacterium]
MSADRIDTVTVNQWSPAALAGGERRRTMRVVSTQTQGFAEVVGREDELTELRATFNDPMRPARPIVRVLTGLGGVGKTSLARAYSARHQRDYGLMWWVRADNPEAVASEFRALLEILAPEEAERVKDPIQAVHAVLANRDGSWLLILDNITHPDAVRGLLPAAGIGDVIVTSRASSWPDSRITMPVRPLRMADAVYLLTSASGDNDRTAAATLAKELGSLPLALAQAACYIAETDDLDLADYLALYRRRRPDMHLEGRAPDYNDPVATTWQLAFDRLAPQSRALLNLLCWYAPDAIPLDRLLGIDDPDEIEIPAQVDSHLRSLLVDELRRYSAISGLAAYSLLIRAGPRGSVSVHRLIQAVTIDYLDAKAASEWWIKAAAAILDAACPEPPATASTLAIWRSLQTHVRTLVEYLKSEWRITLNLRRRLAEWTELAGDFGGACELYRSLIEDMQRSLEIDSRQRLIARINLARCVGKSGNGAKARELLFVLVRETANILGSNDEETLKTRQEYAEWTAECGDYVAALQLLHALLQDMLRILGPDHRETLTTRSNLAWVTGETGEADQARELYVALVDDHVRVLGPDDPRTMIARGCLARWTWTTGADERAGELLTGLLADRLRVLGPDHPDTFTTRAVLADRTGKAGDPAGALDLYQRLLLDCERVLGPDHPDTLDACGNRAYYTAETGDPAGALELYRQLLRDRERVLGPDHRDTLATCGSVAYYTG